MSEETGPTAVCTNCDRELPEEKLFLHEAYCIRNIIRCPKCNEPIDKNEKDEHEEEVHRITACKHCKRDMENKLLAEHEEKCNAKPKLCPFCNCEVAGEEFSHHTYQCGSRTKKCIFCNKNILVRDYDDHEPVCQVNQQNYGNNFPAMQEEAKADIPKNEAPYSSISSKYVQNPSANPYDVLTQGTKSKPKERPESKTSSSKPTHHAREEERKPTSMTTSTSHKVPEQKHPSITSKPLTSVKPDLNNYDRIGLTGHTNHTSHTSHTKQSVPISHKPGLPDYSSHMRAPETTTTTAYTAQTSSNYKPGVSDPRSHIADDKHALSSYLSNKYQEPGKHISSTSKPDIADPLKSKYTSGYSKPTDLHRGAPTDLHRGAPTDLHRGVPTSSAYDGSKYGAGHLGTGITGTKPSVTDNTKTSVRTGVSSLGSKIEPTSTKPTETRSYKPIFPDKTTSTTQNKPGPGSYVPITGTGISSKDITSYSTGISSKPRTESKPSDPLAKKTTSHTGGVSGISGISGTRPSGLSGAGKSTKPTDPTRRTQEDLDTQVARALEGGYHKGTSGRTEPRSHQTQQHRTQQQQPQPSRNVQPNYEDYGHFGGGDDLGEDAELQRAIQESYGGSKKAIPESRNKPSHRQPAPSHDDFGGVGGEDDELQKAIQESLKNSHPSNARSGPNDTWNDETFKRIMERSKHEK